MKTVLILLLLAFIATACVSTPPSHRRPRRPHPGANWVPGHHAPGGHWVPAHWN